MSSASDSPVTPTFLVRELEKAKAGADGCLLCWLEAYAVERYLTGVANDGVNNIPLREKLAARGGYCADHCAQFAATANPLSAAILLEAFLKQRLGKAEQGRRPRDVRCEACEVAEKTHQTFRKSIRQHRSSEPLHALLLDSTLCLSHLETVCGVLPERVRRRLVDKHGGLRGHLAELIRKHDYRFTDETVSEKEKRSIAAALELLGQAKRPGAA